MQKEEGVSKFQFWHTPFFLIFVTAILPAQTVYRRETIVPVAW